MNIYKIIVHAAVNAGIVPSFNLQELPQDVQLIGKEDLEYELLPQMNADRTLDVGVTSGVFQPVDMKITIVQSKNSPVTGHPAPGIYSVPWLPARVDSIMDEGSRLSNSYLYRSEADGLDFRFNPFSYTMEMTETSLILLFRNNNTKRIAYPIPMYIRNDEIVAPPKFRQYLIDALAERLAMIYGMSTLPALQMEVDKSYKSLVKQQPIPLRETNVQIRIRDTLMQGQGRWWQARGFATP